MSTKCFHQGIKPEPELVPKPVQELKYEFCGGPLYRFVLYQYGLAINMLLLNE